MRNDATPEAKDPRATSTTGRAVTMIALVTIVAAMPGLSGAQAAQGDQENVTRDEFDRMCMMPMDGMMDMMTNMTPKTMMATCMMTMPPGMMNATNEEHERMFLMRMVMHHRSAVAMADLALDRAKHAELRDLARDISASQNAEIENMTQWLDEWHNATPPHDTMMDRMMQTQLDTMANMSGDEFDMTFLDHMIMHHEVAVNMTEPMIGRMAHNETRDAASSVVTTQQAEIDQMRVWRSSWFQTRTTPGTTPPTESAETPRDTPGFAPTALILSSLVALFIARRRR